MKNNRNDTSRAVVCLRLLSDVGDELAAEADPFDDDLHEVGTLPGTEKGKNKRRSMLRWGAVAACAVFAAGITLSAIIYKNVLTSEPGDREYPVTYINGKENMIFSYEIWERRSIEDKFDEAHIGSGTAAYRSCVGVTVNADKISGNIGDAHMIGYKFETDETMTLDAAAFSIAGVSESFAVAVRFEGDENYYFYMEPQSEYRPEALGDVVNIAEAISADGVISSLFVLYEPGLPTEYSGKVMFVGLEYDILSDMLFSDPDVEIAADYDFEGKAVMSVGCSTDEKVLFRIIIQVTDNGYIVINAPQSETGTEPEKWSFRIGRDKTDAFCDYVLNNLQGYEITYTEPDDQDREGNGGVETTTMTAKPEP